jgi:hypothetical protein
VQIVWGYDNELQQWLRYRPDGPPPSNTLTEIEAGKGYWIYMRNPGSVTVTGDRSNLPDVRLHIGWNLVGYNGRDGISVGNSLSEVGNGWRIVWKWDDGAWEAAMSEDFPLPLPVPLLTGFRNGKAYWVKAWGVPGYAVWKSDYTPPAIVSTNPLDSGVDAPVSGVIIASFNKHIDRSTVTSESFYLTTGGTRVPGTVGCAGEKVSFAPSANLAYDTTYTATVTKDIRDLKGNSAASDHSWSFTTGPPPEAYMRIGKVGDTFVYSTTVQAGGLVLTGDLTIRLAGTATNLYGVACQAYDMSGTFTGSGRSLPMSTKTISYQDAEGNYYDCGSYDSDTGQYNFILEGPNTPKGLKLETRNPVRVGDVVSTGTVYSQDGTWEDCTYRIEGKEMIFSSAGNFLTYRESQTCIRSDGSNFAGTTWEYPPINSIKDYGAEMGIEMTGTLKSYTLTP